jgi:hypothetical protein
MGSCIQPKTKDNKKNDGAKTQLNEPPGTPRTLAEVAANVTYAKNWLVKSKRFKKMVKDSFEDTDVDKSGTLDVNEVYIAVLKLYLTINGFCKGAVPPTRDDIEKLVDKFDDPGTFSLKEDQFLEFCQFLCTQIATRVMVQMILQFALVPILAFYATKRIEKYMENASETYKEITAYLPMPMDAIVLLVVGVLVGLIVPYIMNLIDYYVLKSAASLEKKIAAAPKRNGIARLIPGIGVKIPGIGGKTEQKKKT